MQFLWEFYQQGRIADAHVKSDRALRDVERVDRRIERLEQSVEQLRLVNIALAELLVERLGVGQDELIAKIKEIDLRDGVQDGKLTSALTVCPQCSRRYNTKANRCLYCGYVDKSNDSFLDRLPLSSGRLPLHWLCLADKLARLGAGTFCVGAHSSRALGGSRKEFGPVGSAKLGSW